MFICCFTRSLFVSHMKKMVHRQRVAGRPEAKFFGAAGQLFVAPVFSTEIQFLARLKDHKFECRLILNEGKVNIFILNAVFFERQGHCPLFSCHLQCP